MAKTILCLLALVVASLAYPADVVPQVPEKTQVVAQLEVHPAETPIKAPQPIQEPVKIIPVQDPIKIVPAQEPIKTDPLHEPVKIAVVYEDIDPERVNPEFQQRTQQIQENQEDTLENQPEAEEDLSHGGPQDIPAGAVGPDVGSNPDANPEEDKSDLEGANTFWGGWGRRWGGYYYPRRHYGWGHGYGRGYGHYGHYGYGRGYGGWGGYYW